jgi:hypothetical protein
MVDAVEHGGDWIEPWYTRQSVSSRIVLIGPADELPGLQERLAPGAEVQTFADSEALEALDHIIEAKPAVVAIQDDFSATSRGTALINRIKADPSLSGCEVRVLARDSELSRAAAKRRQSGGHAVAVDEPGSALDQRGTRRAVRVRVRDGIEVAVDGNPASLVDLSTVGAQVTSPTVLKPNQRVRVTMGDGKAAIRCAGAIVWAAFEMPKGMATRYRAGIDWGITPAASAIEAFVKKNKKP